MSAFRPSVLQKFRKFSVPLEGETHNPYLDVKGLLTVGIGCLIEGSMGYDLPWLIGGQPAPRAEVRAQLQSLKNQPGLARYAYNTPAVMGATSIRLDDAGIEQLADARLAQMEPFMVTAFPHFAEWPADAQLFAASIGWAEGAGWAGLNPNLTHVLNMTPPGFMAAMLHAQDPTHPGMYLAAASDISAKGNPGIIPRNAQNGLCLVNAQNVLDFHLDPSVLYWPNGVPAP